MRGVGSTVCSGAGYGSPQSIVQGAMWQFAGYEQERYRGRNGTFGPIPAYMSQQKQRMRLGNSSFTCSLSKP